MRVLLCLGLLYLLSVTEVTYITSIAFVLSLPELPDASASRDELYLDACISLNTIRDNGQIEDVFFDYLCPAS